MSTMLIARLDDHLAHFMESRDAARAEVTDLQLQVRCYWLVVCMQLMMLMTVS